MSEFFRLPSMASQANKTYEFSPLIELVSKVIPPDNCQATIAGLNLQGRPFLAIRDSRARLDKVQDMLSALNRLRRRTNRRYGIPYLFDAIQHMGGRSGQTTLP
ncbi:MAG TPA: hypothetical protein VHB77_22730 [Planctomycetaceae bacterium]|nr:hypothetical protein [Planctomycetaceae bacterium]